MHLLSKASIESQMHSQGKLQWLMVNNILCLLTWQATSSTVVFWLDTHQEANSVFNITVGVGGPQMHVDQAVDDSLPLCGIILINLGAHG